MKTNLKYNSPNHQFDFQFFVEWLSTIGQSHLMMQDGH